MHGTSRPAWGCLDAQEIRNAAAGRIADPAIDEHLARCGDCRHAVADLGGAVRLGGARRPVRTGATGGVRYRRSVLSRPGFWFVLLALGLGAYGVSVLIRQKRPLAPETSTTAAPEPVASPAPKPKKRRPRPARASGSPDDAGIVDVIRKNQTGVRMCYERALKRDHSLSLRVDVQVNVSAAGVPDRVALDGIADGAPLANCIRNVIKTWQFPRAAAAYEAEFPLRLQQSLSP